MKAFKVAAVITLICALALVALFGSLALTMTAFTALGFVGDGWMMIASLVWLLEIVFMSVLIAEIAS